MHLVWNYQTHYFCRKTEIMKTRSRTQRQKQMFTLIESCIHKGDNKSRFCKEQGIRKSTFYYWHKKYTQKKRSGNSGFIPVRIDNRDAEVPPGKIEIQYPNGVRLLLTANTKGLSSIKELITIY